LPFKCNLQRYNAAPSAATTSAATASLVRNGFVVLEAAGGDSGGGGDSNKNIDSGGGNGNSNSGSNCNSNSGGGLVSREVLDRAERASGAYLDQLLAGVTRRGFDAEEDIFRFAEVCSRARAGRRYDVTAGLYKLHAVDT
jgi:hypothetical protein